MKNLQKTISSFKGHLYIYLQLLRMTDPFHPNPQEMLYPRTFVAIPQKI